MFIWDSSNEGRAYTLEFDLQLKWSLSRKSSAYILEVIFIEKIGIYQLDIGLHQTLYVPREQEIFSGGAKPLFSIFSRCEFSLFQVEISILVDPEKVSVLPEKWKATKKKRKRKRKKVISFFHSIFPYISHFPPSIFHSSLFSSFPLHFSSFSSTFSSFFFTLFSLPHFSRLVTRNFPVESLGGTLPPPPRLLRHSM